MSLQLNSIPDNKFSIEDLQSLVKEDFKEMDKILRLSLKSDISLIEKVATHIIYAGGKRIRPLLCLLGAKIFHPSPLPNALYLATAIEFIHTATLLHDDVVDDSHLRRGQPAAHKMWGNSASILVGDYLFARAFELMVKTGNPLILQILSQASARIAAGEVLQLMHSHSIDITESIALKIIGAKTAELFAAACQAGALAGGAPSSQAEALRQYGYALGMVFQITDDILDYTSASSRGKNLGDDLSEGKMTLPLIYAYHHATPSDKSDFARLISESSASSTHFSSILQMIQQYKGFEEARLTANRFAEEALDSLKEIESPFISHLTGLIHFCLTRQV